MGDLQVGEAVARHPEHLGAAVEVQDGLPLGQIAAVPDLSEMGDRGRLGDGEECQAEEEREAVTSDHQ